MKNLTHIDIASFYRSTGVAEPINDGFCLAATTESLQPILPPEQSTEDRGGAVVPSLSELKHEVQINF